MKFISLFTKAPQHQRFNYTPRFYDPRKEEMEEREKRIKNELEMEKGTSGGDSDRNNYRSRIMGSFQAARRRSKPGAEKNAVIIRLSVLLFLTLFIMAYLTWGKAAIYSLIVVVPIYIYLKFKK